jgi:hypothetical protein
LAALVVGLAGCGEDIPSESADESADTGESSGDESDESSDESDESDESGSETSSTLTTTSSSSDSSDTSGSSTSGSTDSGDSSSDEIPDSAVGALIDEICDWTYSCCSDSERDSLLGPHFGDADDCKARIREELQRIDVTPPVNNLQAIDPLLFTIAYEIDLTRSEPVEAAIETCRASLAARTCNPEASDVTLTCQTFVDDACSLDKLFVGKVPAGGECSGRLRGPFRDIECVAGTSCEDTKLDVGNESSADEFRCAAKGGLGDLCSPAANSMKSEGPCEYGLYCTSEGKCAQLPGEGESCAFGQVDAPEITKWFALYAGDADPDIAFDLYKGNENIPCAPGLDCDAVTNTCAKWCETGASCDAPADGLDHGGELSAQAYCDEGLGCLPYTLTSDSELFFFQCASAGGLDQKCNDSRDCSSDFYCAGLDLAKDITGKCTPRVDIGEACDPAQSACDAQSVCSPCGLAEHRNAPGGDLNAKPLLGACDVNADGSVNSGDLPSDVTHMCQSPLPAATSEEQRCAGTFGATLAADIEYQDAVCADGSWCAYTGKLSNGTTVEPDYYCISKGIGYNVACRPNETGDHFGDPSLNFVSDQDRRHPWSNDCAEDFICYDPDDYGSPSCQAGVLVDQPCDYDESTANLGHCGYELHCVEGACQPFLEPGESCDPESNEWDASTDEGIRTSGFDARRCNPYSSSCQQIHGDYHCTVFDQVTDVRNYCIGN